MNNASTNAANLQYNANARSGLGAGITGFANNTNAMQALQNMWSNSGAANTYNTTPGSQQTNMLAEQDAWFR